MFGIYCRVSTLGQLDNYSLGVQEKTGINFCNSQKEKYRIYKEQGSGASITRHKLEDLINDIRKGIINKVWVIEFTRLSRSVEDLQILKKVFNEYKVDLYINGQLFDINKPDHVLMYNIYGAFAEHERSNAIERSKRGKKQSIDSGNGVVSSIYGYDHKYKENGESLWVINEEEGYIIRKIFELYLSGHSQRQISKYLNNNHYHSKEGAPWFTTKISRVITRLLYTGRTYNTEGNIIRSNKFTPIIAIETWEKAQKIAESKNCRISQTRKGAKKVLYFSSAIVRCKICGEGYYHKRKPYSDSKREPMRRYYFCRHDYDCKNKTTSLKKDYLDNILFYTTMEFLENQDDILTLYKKEMKKIESIQESNKDKKKHLIKQKNTLQNRKEKLVTAISNEVIEHKDAKFQMESLKLEIETIDKEIDEIDGYGKQMKKEWDLILAKFSHDRRHELNELYEDGKEHEVNNIFKEVIKSALLEDDILYIEYITGRKMDIDIKNLPPILDFRINKMDEYLGIGE